MYQKVYFSMPLSIRQGGADPAWKILKGSYPFSLFLLFSLAISPVIQTILDHVEKTARRNPPKRTRLPAARAPPQRMQPGLMQQ
jgi:hypothetical protein